jgi:hypothetical protein
MRLYCMLCLIIPFLNHCLGESSTNSNVLSDNDSTSYILPFDINDVYNKSVLESINDPHTYVSTYQRRQIGSNCVYIERGTVSPYYGCVGCVVEQAMGCITDMRRNLSGTVRHGCNINKLNQHVDHTCCPALTEVGQLMYIGSSYISGMECLESVGCASTVLYTDVLNECKATCHELNPFTQSSICLTRTGAAIRSISWSFWSVVMVSMTAFLLCSDFSLN